MKVLNVTASGQLPSLSVRDPRFYSKATNSHAITITKKGTANIAVELATGKDTAQLFGAFNLDELYVTMPTNEVLVITAE